MRRGAELVQCSLPPPWGVAVQPASHTASVESTLAENEDGSRLYAANLGSDAVAVLDPRRLHSMSGKGMVEPIGFVPTELMPMALASVGRTLYVASAKGKGLNAV